MKHLSLLFVLLLSGFAFVQAQNSYTITPITFNPDPYTGGTPCGLVTDDVWSPRITLPFSFCFYDSAYNEVSLGSNGQISFQYQTPGGYCAFTTSSPMPGANYSDRTILGPMQDLNPAVGGSIEYDIRGVAPYRRFIINYYQVPFFSCTALQFTAQTILYETTNIIETHILDMPVCQHAIHGLQINAGLGFSIPGRSGGGAPWTTVNEGYRFSPSGSCQGAPAADTIAGTVFADVNSNCLQDPNEFPIMNRGVIANGGQYYGWTNSNGYYELNVAPGTYAVSEFINNSYMASSCNPGGIQTVTTNGGMLGGVDFPDSVEAFCTDLVVGIGAVAYRRCQNSSIHVTYANYGSIPDSNAVVTVTLVDSLQILTSNLPYTTVGANTYAFNVGLLMPGQTGTINLLCHVGCDTVGTIHCISAQIAGTSVDCDGYNNQDNDCMAVTAPMDPNSKHVAAQHFAAMGYVTDDDIDANDTLTYRIDFQNVGTAYAEDVVVRDVLDDSRLDLSTLLPGAASAPYQYLLVGNEVVFRFENIMLADSNTNEPASHGFVKFRIHQRPGNQPGTVIENDAAIYFDFEAPVITNATHNTIPLASSVLTGNRSLGEVYPNPGREQLVVRRRVEGDLQFVLMDIAGKEVRRLPLTSVQTIVPTADLKPGLYLYRIDAEGQAQQSGKWVKQ